MRQVFAAMGMSGVGPRAKHRQHVGKARRHEVQKTPDPVAPAGSRTGNEVHAAAVSQPGIRPSSADALRARP